MIKKALSSVKKFYLLDYFYVLLKSVEKYNEREQIFELFKDLKQEHGLGESKYRKLTADAQVLTKVQLLKYEYTFKKVIEESIEYDLIKDNDGKYYLSDIGRKLIEQYNISNEEYVTSLFILMESKYEAFRYIIDLLYRSSKLKSGLFVLPVYSPLQLDFERSEIKTTNDIKRYSEALVKKLQQDIVHYLGETRDLSLENKKILSILVNDGLIPADESSEFYSLNYNAIIKRFRDFWLKYFLQEIYKYEYFYNSFEIWTYRAKQIGIINATEFYPFFSGKIVYPTAVIVKTTDSQDFKKIFDYSDGYSLFVHKPSIETNQNKFVDFLVNAYYDIRRTNRSNFVSLAALREMVCYNLKISELVFQQLLDSVYHANLEGNLRIKISLEVDRLPEETKAMYLKKEPVMVDGKFRNIIAIDVARGE